MKTFDETAFIQYPLYVQAKRNGVYCELGTDGILRSKTGKVFPAVQKAFNWPKPRHTLYGELYLHGLSLQEIISGVTPDEPNENTRIISLCAFDIDAQGNFGERIRLLAAEVKYLNFHKIISVSTECCNTHAEMLQLYAGALESKFEGIVIRDSFGGVWKKKPYQDKEFLCTGVIEGKGKRAGHVGKFCFVTEDGKRFNCGGGRVSYAELKKLYENPPKNKMITLRYHSTSDDGIPLCAQFIAIRNYD